MSSAGDALLAACEDLNMRGDVGSIGATYQLRQRPGHLAAESDEGGLSIARDDGGLSRERAVDMGQTQRERPRPAPCFLHREVPHTGVELTEILGHVGERNETRRNF